MEKLREYIVDIESGEVIWISYNVKNILSAYNLIGYDVKRKFLFFSHSKRKEIIEIIKYESKIVF